jgi:hypothetical protein
MVREKIDAALDASGRLMAGASGETIVRGYRNRVAANAKRLEQAQFGSKKKEKTTSKIVTFEAPR